MLMISDRTKREDIQLYSSLYHPMDRMKNIPWGKVNESEGVLRKWIAAHDDAVAYTSWGKDSVVLMYLIALYGAKIPCVYMRTPTANPDCIQVRDRFLKEFDINYHEVEFTRDQLTTKDGHWKAIADKYGHHRITGLRKDESGIRRMVWGKFGMSSDLSCRPLSLWTGAEIFAYIEQMGLPLCAVYGYLGGGRWPREHIRTHSLVGSAGDNRGRTEWEREYYPDMVNRILAGQKLS